MTDNFVRYSFIKHGFIKYFFISLFLFFSGVSHSQTINSDDMQLLRSFSERIVQARDVSLQFSSTGGSGFVSFGKEAVYMSYKNKTEVYETNGVRYLYNKKRERVEIDSVSTLDDNVRVLIAWAELIEHYEVELRARRSGDVRYRLTAKDDRNEIVEIDFSSNGDIKRFEYQNADTKKIVFQVSDMKINGAHTASYFSFDPENRCDLDVVDFR